MTLREARKQLNMTRVQAAILIKVSPQTFALWEQGAVRPNWLHASAIQKFFGDVDEIRGLVKT